MTPETPADAVPAVAAPDDLLGRVVHFLDMGGAAMYAIAALSVFVLALILWKLWSLWRVGAFSGGRVTERAVALWEAGDRQGAIALLQGRRSARARVVLAAMRAAMDARLERPAAEAATEQVARAALADAAAGLRFLDLAASVGPLLGLLGTVTGMIAAFQGLAAAGVRADTATLAGGIWEALLTTAAGMAVAIPAMIAQHWFEAVIESLRHAMEDGATRVFVAQDRARAVPLRVATEGGEVVNWAQAAARAVAQARQAE
jgi:biopolymer transport protein ExbB